MMNTLMGAEVQGVNLFGGILQIAHVLGSVAEKPQQPASVFFTEIVGRQ